MSGTTEPKVVKLDQMDLLAVLSKLLQSQADNAAVQRRLLEIEVAKQEAQKAKDVAKEAFLEKSRKQLHDQMQIRLENIEKQIANCSHKDQRGGSTIYPISNHPDRRVRGVCVHCPIYIEPEHYEIGANGEPKLVKEHPLYKSVLQRDQDLYAAFVPTTNY